MSKVVVIMVYLKYEVGLPVRYCNRLLYIVNGGCQ